MSGDQQIFDEAMNQGHSAAWDQDWEKATSHYRIATDEFPDNYNALTSLGLALFELQKYQESLVYYQRASQVAPQELVPLQKLVEIYERTNDPASTIKSLLEIAEVYARNRDIDKAIHCWTEVIGINPDHLTAHMRLAVVYERLGRNSEAMVEYISIAGILQNQGNIQKAIQTMKHAVQVVPNSKEANQLLIMLQMGKPLPRPPRAPGVTRPLAPTKIGLANVSQTGGNPPRRDPIQDAMQKAQTMLAEMLFEQEEAQGPNARKGMANILKGRVETGKDDYDQVKIIHHLSQAIDLESHGDDVHAITQLERAMEAGLDSSAAYYSLGFMQSKCDLLEPAVQNIRKSVKHELFSLGARLLLALTLHKMDSIKEASIEYLEALRIADSQSVAADQAEELFQLYESLIETYTQQSDEKLQKRICDNVCRLLVRPDWREQIQLARQQLPSQPSGSAPIPLAEMLTESTSGQLVESLAKVNQLAKANKLLSAMEEAYYALRFAPTYLPLHVCIGDLLVQENRIPEAIEKYSIIARNYSIRGEVNRAIGLYRRVRDLAPMNLDARNELIDLLIARGNDAETVEEFIKLAETYYNRADIAMARKTYSRAFRYVQQANSGRDVRIRLLQRMGDIDMQSLDWRNAIKIFEQIRTLDPDDVNTRDRLFELNLRLGQLNQAMAELDNFLNHLMTMHRSGEALEYVDAKILENPNQPALYRRQAELYRLLGRKEDAIRQLEISKEMFLQAQNRAAAIECVMAILALNPENSNAYQQMLVELQAG